MAKKKIDDFDEIFEKTSDVNSQPPLDTSVSIGYKRPKGACLFRCHKSFQESRIFRRDNDVVVYSILFRNAEIKFSAGKAPKVSKNGHFEDVDIGNEFEFTDPWVDGFEIRIESVSEKKKIEKIVNSKNWEKSLEAAGFSVEIQYDILIDELSGSTIEISI